MLTRECESAYVETPDQIRLHLRRWNLDKDRRWLNEAIVFLHGFGEGGFVWDDVISRIDHHIPCFALDFRGHGDSDWDRAGQYDTELHARDFLAVVDKLNIRRLWVVGHSMGADVAIRASAQLGARLAGLVIVDYGPDISDEGRQRVREDFRNSLRPYVSAAAYQDYLESTRILGARNMLAHFAVHATRKGPDNFFYLKADPALANGLKKNDPQVLWTLLGGINCPALLIRGAGSAVLNQMTARRVASCMPRCVFRQVEIAGHAVMLDNPGGFADALVPFLSQYFQPAANVSVPASRLA